MGTSTLTGSRFMVQLAQKFGALLVSIEHRFYGASIPGDGTLSTENLRLLSADQALADYAVVIAAVKKQYGLGDGSKVVTFGGSYSGSLSAWMRQKYPFLVHAALASSAPVLAQLDFPQYHEVIHTAVGEQCSAHIRGAMTEIVAMLETVDGKERLQTDFNTCDEIANDDDEVWFLETLTDSVAAIVQYSDDNNSLGKAYNIARMCQLIDSNGGGYNGFVTFFKDYMDVMGDSCAESSYSKFHTQLSDTTPGNEQASFRSWYYQTCNEYGYYQTGSSENQPFSDRISLDFFIDTCTKVYGIDATSPAKAVDYTNEYYGGLNVAATRIIYTNGSVDPWHALGITTGSTDENPVYYMHGTAHCADLYDPSENDVADLTAARAGITEYLSKWLA